MHISIWQQFSSNNSSNFTVVGVFETLEAAQHAADELQEMIKTLQAWWDQNPDAWNDYVLSDERPTPLEAEIGKRFGFEWPYAVEWYHRASISVVLDRFVYLTTEGFRPDTAGEPFDKVLTGLGGQGLLDGNYYGDQIGTILAEINCTAPDEATAQEIIEKYLCWEQYVTCEGQRLQLIDWPFSEFDIVELITYLKNKNCTDIHCRLYQAATPYAEPPTAKDASALIRILGSEKLWDIDKIAYALAALGDTRAVEPLIRAFDHSDIGLDRFAIVSALGDLHDSRAIDLLVPLLNETGELSPAPSAAKALAKIGDQRAIQPLIKFLNSDKHWHTAAESLAAFGQSAQDALLKARADSGPPLEARLTHALSLINAANDFALEFLALRDENPDKQKQAFEAVKLSPRATDLLIAILQNPPEPYMRTEAANALSEIREPRAIEQIEEYLPYLGREGVAALEKFGISSVNTLMKLVQNPEPWVREAAAQSLLRLADPRSADTLIAVLQDAQWDPLIKSIVAQGLAQIGDVRAILPMVNLFIESSAHWHPELDKWIIESLKKLNGTTELVTKLLSELAQDSEFPAATRTIGALGALGDKQAIAPLVVLMDHPSPYIRYAANDALNRLGYFSSENQS